MLKNTKIFINNNQYSEQLFAKMFSGQENINLIYTDQIPSACTNGELIMINPEMNNLQNETEKFYDAEKILSWDKIKKTTFDTETKLYIISHGLLLHECLHLIYTDFSTSAYKDKEIPLQYQKPFSYLYNIIEDAYIEAVGGQEYPKIKYFLQFVNILLALKNNEKSQKYKKIMTNETLLNQYMYYISNKILYPLTELPEPEGKLKEAVDETIDILYEAIGKPTGPERYQKTKEVLKKLIKLNILAKDYIDPPVLRQSNETEIGKKQNSNKKGNSQPVNYNIFGNVKYGRKPETPAPDSNKAAQNPIQVILKRNYKAAIQQVLNCPNDEALPENPNMEQLKQEIKVFLTNLEEKIKEAKQEEITDQTSETRLSTIEGEKYGKIHKSVSIQESFITPKKEYIGQYENCKKNCQAIIHRYKNKFLELLKSKTDIYEKGYLYGVKIDSKNLTDHKKKYWQRKAEDTDTPELAIQILIDNSGSMSGPKTQAAKTASIVIHEILEANHIKHSIACFHSIEKVYHKILLDFNHKKNDKYAIMDIWPSGNNRDGLALAWGAERLQKCRERDKILIIISDGIPSHYNSDEIAIEDIKKIRQKCQKNNIKLIAIALEEKRSKLIYTQLQKYYDPKTILHCNNPEELPEKLAKLITAELNR